MTANEGDAHAWGEDYKAYWTGGTSKGFVEEWHMKHLVHKNHPEIFNFNHEEGGLDNRSDNKGPEPFR